VSWEKGNIQDAEQLKESETAKSRLWRLAASPQELYKALIKGELVCAISSIPSQRFISRCPQAVR